MKILTSGLRLGAWSLGLAALVMSSACNNPMQPAQPAAAAQPNDVGRYQITVVSEGDRATFVLLVDSKEGATWVYRPPQGTAINGFWSDIPRLTYAPDYWRTVFTQQPGQPQPSGTTPSPGTTPAPPPTR